MTMALKYAHIAGQRGGTLVNQGPEVEEAAVAGGDVATTQQQQQHLVPGTAPLDLHHLVSPSDEQELRLVQQAEAAGLHVSPVLELQVSEGHTVKLMVLLKPCDLGEGKGTVHCAAWPDGGGAVLFWSIVFGGVEAVPWLGLCQTITVGHHMTSLM
jgi:hypothetical protein